MVVTSTSHWMRMFYLLAWHTLHLVVTSTNHWMRMFYLLAWHTLPFVNVSTNCWIRMSSYLLAWHTLHLVVTSTNHWMRMCYLLAWHTLNLVKISTIHWMRICYLQIVNWSDSNRILTKTEKAIFKRHKNKTKTKTKTKQWILDTLWTTKLKHIYYIQEIKTKQKHLKEENRKTWTKRLKEVPRLKKRVLKTRLKKYMFLKNDKKTDDSRDALIFYFRVNVDPIVVKFSRLHAHN